MQYTRSIYLPIYVFAYIYIKTSHEQNYECWKFDKANINRRHLMMKETENLYDLGVKKYRAHAIIIIII